MLLLKCVDIHPVTFWKVLFFSLPISWRLPLLTFSYCILLYCREVFRFWFTNWWIYGFFYGKASFLWEGVAILYQYDHGESSLKTILHYSFNLSAATKTVSGSRIWQAFWWKMSWVYPSPVVVVGSLAPAGATLSQCLPRHHCQEGPLDNEGIV